ncbi:MAG: hypothetical protein LBB21_00795 [Holosporaceae bacterium]|jgi:hypothetical protein|nr:hypothetical protein [Holosporaceae bacterium]
MKKRFFVFGCFAFLMQASVADSAVDAANEEPAAEDNCCTKDNHEGVYGVIGLGVSHNSMKAINKDHTVRVSGFANRNWGATEENRVRNILAQAASYCAATQVLDYGPTYYRARGAVDQKIYSGNSNNFSGHLALGVGHLYGSGYVGCELSCDLGAKSKKSGQDGSLTNIRAGATAELKGSGVIPAIGARVGFFIDGIGTLLFLKGGVAWSKLDINSNVGGMKASANAKFCSPIVALGVEKNVGHVVIRGEIERRVRSSKIVDLNYGSFDVARAAGNVLTVEEIERVRLKSDAWTVRVSVVKHINVFKN